MHVHKCWNLAERLTNAEYCINAHVDQIYNKSFFVNIKQLIDGMYVEKDKLNKTIFWIPPGFAHGFVSLADNTILSYKCTNYYNKESEGGIAFNDPDIKIDWKLPKDQLLISEKDKQLPFLRECTNSLHF